VKETHTLLVRAERNHSKPQNNNKKDDDGELWKYSQHQRFGQSKIGLCLRFFVCKHVFVLKYLKFCSFNVIYNQLKQ
jgi:hypothetical protein